MNNTTYDILKWIAQIFLPALTVFIGVVLECFNVESANIIITIMTAFDAFLGSILGLSSAKYYHELDEE